MKVKKLAWMSSIMIMSLVAGCGQSSTNTTERTEKVYQVTPGEKNLEGTISISTYWCQQGLQDLASAFEKKYPGTHIEINSFIQGLNEIDEGKTVEQYIKHLNTAIMSGEAEDLLLLEDIPTYKYIQSGYLTDLTPMITGEDGLNNEEYYMKAIDTLKYKDSYYGIPIGFDIPFLAINETIYKKAGLDETKWTKAYWNLEEQLKVVEQVREQYDKETFLLPGDGMSAFNEYYGGGLEYIDLVNRKVYIDTPEFVNALKDIKGLVDKGYIKDDYQDNKHVFDGLAVNEAPLYNREFFEFRDVEQEDYTWCRAIKPKATSEGKIKINLSLALGITEASTNKDLCWEFIKFVVSEEAQSQLGDYCIPVNRAAIKPYIKTLMDNAKRWKSCTYVVSEEEVYEDYVKRLEEWLSHVEGYYGISQVDNAIMTTLQEEIDAYFKGEKEAEEVAQLLQNKISVMLNE